MYTVYTVNNCSVIFISVFYYPNLMSNPSISMGKLFTKGIFPLIHNGYDFELWDHNTDRKK